MEYTEENAVFSELGCAVIKNFVPKELLNACCDYLEVIKNDHLQKIDSKDPFPENDKFHPKTFSYYAPLCTEVVLTNSIGKIEKVTGDSVVPSFSYARTYYNGSELERHTDRNGANYGVSICIDKDGNDWPLHIIDRDGTNHAVELDRGDAVVFCGMELEHWRNKFEGVFQTQIFLFYVSEDLEQSNYFDGRSALGNPPASHIKSRSK